MALTTRLGRRSRRRGLDTVTHSHGAITASAAVLNVSDRREANRVRALRQGWQTDAWSYRDQIGELHYAFGFVSHAASRMRYFPAAYPTGAYDEEPVVVEEANLSSDTIAAAYLAMNAFATGQVAMSEKMGRLSENVSVAGEAYVLGVTDPMTGADSWTIRSIDEIVQVTTRPKPGSSLRSYYSLREVPLDANSNYSGTPLDPDMSYIARVWNPHPRFAQLADSSMRAIMDLCEELLILSRNIRAVGRSALAGNGMLLMPSSLLRRSSFQTDNLDPRATPFFTDLTEAMMAPIADEGTASAVVPLLVSGDIADLAAVRHLAFLRPLDPQLMAQRLELIGRMATGIDLPKEVLTGVADLNHWTAWQVDDNTFRHHLENHVITCCDMHAVGFLRPYMLSLGCNPDEVERVVTWYDPTPLVTHPDLTATAQALYGLDVISAKALRRVSGFDERDAPDPLELELDLVRKTRTWPPNVLMALLGKLDPNLTIPAITTPGTIPGIKAGAVTAIPPTTSPGTPSGDGGGGGDDESTDPPPPDPGPPPGGADGPPPPEVGPPGLGVVNEALLAALTAAEASRSIADDETSVAYRSAQLSRRLTEIDSVLRARLQAAANAAISRVLERAGSKLRTKLRASKSPIVKQQSSNPTPNVELASVLGPALVADAGMTTGELVANDWTELKEIFDHWTSVASEDALTTACAIVNVDPSSAKATAVRDELGKSRTRAWDSLSSMMSARSAQLLYKPVKTPPPKTAAQVTLPPVNPDTQAPTNMIRQALSIAGGAGLGGGAGGATIGSAGEGVMAAPTGQIGSGGAIADFLSTSGAEPSLFEWKCGAPALSFEPHHELDGVQFSSWDDEVLDNPDSFPDVSYFVPGDHVGCCCDFQVLWEPGASGVSTDGGYTTASPPSYPNWPQIDGAPLAGKTTPYSRGVLTNEQKIARDAREQELKDEAAKAELDQQALPVYDNCPLCGHHFSTPKNKCGSKAACEKRQARKGFVPKTTTPLPPPPPALPPPFRLPPASRAPVTEGKAFRYDRPLISNPHRPPIEHTNVRPSYDPRDVNVKVFAITLDDGREMQLTVDDRVAAANRPTQDEAQHALNVLANYQEQYRSTFVTGIGRYGGTALTGPDTLLTLHLEPQAIVGKGRYVKMNANTKAFVDPMDSTAIHLMEDKIFGIAAEERHGRGDYGWFMAEHDNASNIEATISHEFGHVMHNLTGEQEIALETMFRSLAPPPMTFTQARMRLRAHYGSKALKSGFFKSDGLRGMQEYGYTTPRETYAECFSEWVLSKGTTSSEVARSYAQRFNWDRHGFNFGGEEST